MSSDTTEDYGPDMQQFVCSVCEEKHYDINHYFKGMVSTKCLWCAKYSKVKPKPITKEGEVT